MISERKFSSTYTSFWNEILPMGDAFVRQLNLSCKRFSHPYDSNLPVDRDRRAIINELSFRLFKAQVLKNTADIDRVKLSRSVILYISRLSNQINLRKTKIREKEFKEAEMLARTLSEYFKRKELKSLVFWPSFTGCGLINSCKGDIILGKNLIEVKAGDRKFRLPDIRQLITYLSLNFYSERYELENVALVNPRAGLSFEISVDGLIESSSGRKPVDVFSDIIEFISFELSSR